MDKQNKIYYFLAMILAIFLILSGANLYLFWELKKESKEIRSKIDSNQTISINMKTDENKERTVLDTSKIDKGAGGTIESIDQDKIVVHQFSSQDTKMLVLKTDVNKILKSEKNDSFDQGKSFEINNKIHEIIKKNSFVTKEEILENPNIPAGIKEYVGSQSSEPYISKEISWNDLKVGMKVNIIKDGQKMNVTVLSGNVSDYIK